VAKTIAKMLDVPYIVDATVLTEAGYVEDVESILTRLLQAADYDVGKPNAESYLLTKLIKLLVRVIIHQSRDVSGEGATSVIETIEGTVVSPPLRTASRPKIC
jgi:ATP-dependent Clp protease ATP-binding subunit ClpX